MVSQPPCLNCCVIYPTCMGTLCALKMMHQGCQALHTDSGLEKYYKFQIGEGSQGQLADMHESVSLRANQHAA